MDEMKLLMRRLAVIRRIADLAPDPGKTSIQKIAYFLQSGLNISLELPVQNALLWPVFGGARRQALVGGRDGNRGNRPRGLLAMDITSSRANIPLKMSSLLCHGKKLMRRLLTWLNWSFRNWSYWLQSILFRVSGRGGIGEGSLRL